MAPARLCGMHVNERWAVSCMCWVASYVWTIDMAHQAAAAADDDDDVAHEADDDDVAPARLGGG